jgi:hypothetical protein
MIEKAVDADLRKFKENILFCWGTLAFPMGKTDTQSRQDVSYINYCRKNPHLEWAWPHPPVKLDYKLCITKQQFYWSNAPGLDGSTVSGDQARTRGRSTGAVWKNTVIRTRVSKKQLLAEPVV